MALGMSTDPRNLVVNLESLLAEYSGDAPVKEIVLAGLRWDTEYWPALAIAWIEQGAEIDEEVKMALDHVARQNRWSQSVRHKAFTLARRWERTNA
jgi:hypothetical protein